MEAFQHKSKNIIDSLVTSIDSSSQKVDFNMKITELYNEDLKEPVCIEEQPTIEELMMKGAEPIAQSLRVFNIFDINKNGKIDINEVRVICKSLNLHPTNVTFSNSNYNFRKN